MKPQGGKLGVDKYVSTWNAHFPIYELSLFFKDKGANEKRDSSLDMSSILVGFGRSAKSHGSWLRSNFKFKEKVGDIFEFSSNSTSRLPLLHL